MSGFGDYFFVSGVPEDRRFGQQFRRDPGHNRLGEISADSQWHVPWKQGDRGLTTSWWEPDNQDTGLCRVVRIIRLRAGTPGNRSIILPAFSWVSWQDTGWVDDMVIQGETDEQRKDPSHLGWTPAATGRTRVFDQTRNHLRCIDHHLRSWPCTGR